MCRRLAPLLGLLLVASPAARAGSIAGVCPDGSAFIVQSVADVPCRRAKLVDPSDLPPIRPELLPRPYTWSIDQKARDPHNPYNLIEAAEKIRALQEERAGAGALERERKLRREGSPRVAPRPLLDFSRSEVRDLVRLVELRQQIAPATLRVDDVQGQERMEIELAHSLAFEWELLSLLRESTEKKNVLLFLVRGLVATEFHPNFLVVQDALSFRPDPGTWRETGFLAGTAGEVAPGSTLLGYLVIPARFDLARPMDLWWNDRSLSATLAPPD